MRNSVLLKTAHKTNKKSISDASDVNVLKDNINSILMLEYR